MLIKIYYWLFIDLIYKQKQSGGRKRKFWILTDFSLDLCNSICSHFLDFPEGEKNAISNKFYRLKVPNIIENRAVDHLHIGKHLLKKTLLKLFGECGHQKTGNICSMSYLICVPDFEIDFRSDCIRHISQLESLIEKKLHKNQKSSPTKGLTNLEKLVGKQLHNRDCKFWVSRFII